MKVTVIYDSTYGNTKKIASIVANTISEQNEIVLLHVKEVKLREIRSSQVLILGSPTHYGKDTPDIEEFINRLKPDDIAGKAIATFDTRNDIDRVGRGLKTVMRLMGYAAEKMERKLVKIGGRAAVPCQGFFVEDKEGPLRSGETERASEWASRILDHIRTLNPVPIGA